MGNNINKKINIALEYGKELIGTRYGFFKGSMTDHPCYADNKSIPSVIHECNCIGLINLIRKHLYLHIPYHEVFPGGIRAWIDYLKIKKVLNMFDIKKQYPRGSLLISPNTKEFQGHIAILYKVNTENFRDSELLHSFPDNEEFSYLPVNPGVCITTINDGPMKGNYKYICEPKGWLTK